MQWQEKSIRRQLLEAIMLTSGVALLLAAAALVGFEMFSLRKAMAEHLTSLAQVIAANCAAPLAFENRDDAEEVLASLRTEPHLELAVLYDRRRRPFAAFRTAPAAAPAAPRLEDEGFHFRAGRLEVIQPVIQAGTRLGTLYLRSDLGAIHQRVFAYGLIAVAVAASSLLVGLAFSRRLQARISGPVLALAEAARLVSEKKDYSVQLRKQTGGELGLLTDTFNRMVEEIRRSHEELEQRVEQRTAELAAANRELEAFSYSVSHDLRAPLRHMMSFAKLLEKNAVAELKDRDRRHLQVIADAGARMERLIDDLLAFSRIGRAVLTETDVSLTQLVSEARQELAPAIAGRLIEWSITPLPQVRGDPTLLRSVLVNLLSNAIKYTRGRNPARIEVGSETREHEFIVYVRDNGAGFDMRFVDKLFGVFQRLHRAQDFEGTGIGLASVRRVIQRHGGRAWAEGAVERGATFYFSLPKGHSKELPRVSRVSLS